MQMSAPHKERKARKLAPNLKNMSTSRGHVEDVWDICADYWYVFSADHFLFVFLYMFHLCSQAPMTRVAPNH